MKDNQNNKDGKGLSQIALYTDGACTGNPGPGGWGVVIVRSSELGVRTGEKPILLSGKAAHTTNNQMELTAVIKGLERICDFTSDQGRDPSTPDRFADLCSGGQGLEMTIYLDSQYVKQGIQERIKTWKRNGWKTSGRKPVANKELRQELDLLVGLFNIEWHWVKGHNGNKYNEMADKLATGVLNSSL